jgi:hypothetical protein
MSFLELADNVDQSSFLSILFIFRDPHQLYQAGDSESWEQVGLSK